MALSLDRKSIAGIQDFIREGSDILECLKNLGARDDDLSSLSAAIKSQSYSAFHSTFDKFLKDGNKPGGCIYREGSRVGIPPALYTKGESFGINFGRYDINRWQVETLSININSDELHISHQKRTIADVDRYGHIRFENGDTLNGRLIHKDTLKPSMTSDSGESQSHYYAYDQHVGRELYSLVRMFIFDAKRNESWGNTHSLKEKISDLESLSDAILPWISNNEFGVDPVVGADKAVLELIEQVNTHNALKLAIQPADEAKTLQF